jgi:hypothetical protein
VRVGTLSKCRFGRAVFRVANALSIHRLNIGGKFEEVLSMTTVPDFGISLNEHLLAERDIFEGGATVGRIEFHQNAFTSVREIAR